jgi:riboflavin kinase/FMN adenylyltransferase
LHTVSDLQSTPVHWQQGAVSIGNFDGVHRGHCNLINRLRCEADRVDGPAVVLTFCPHPIQLLRPDDVPPSLTSLDRKLDLLAATGVDVCITYPTTLDLLALSPEAFFQSVIVEQLAARSLVEGPNFHFGRDRRGDTELLTTLCEQADIDVHIVSPSLADDEFVSSSRIRSAILQGDVMQASQMLGYCYQIQGRVVRGANRGHTIGFPTANLADVEVLLPAPGVYAGRAVANGISRPAAIHIGPNPTFGETGRKIEVHLLDFAGDLYDQVLTVEFVDRIRGTRRFDSAEQLVNQLNQDVAQVRSTSSTKI